MLKALELVGFKSFADKTRFEFPPGITVVVGPNGSGKSNIVDAIKWVLGEQSAKSLRGQDMADVIFKGSGASGRKPLNAAEATIIIDNSDGRLPIDAPEVHVTRRVYRSGEGEYLINRQPSRLKDIRDLFRGTGVGTDAYSLIEQGKVDKLLQASSKDRRAIFEEAAGISRFKAKKIEAQRRLERVEQNLLRLSDIVDEVDNRLKAVRAQAAKARRYKEYSDRLQQLRTQVGLVDWRRLTKRLAEIEAELARLREAAENAAARVESAEARALELELQIGACEDSLRANESRSARVRERIAQRESTCDHQRARCRDFEEAARTAREQLVAMFTRVEDAESRLRETARSLKEAETAHRELAAHLQELEDAQAASARELNQCRAESETLRGAYVEQTRLVATLGTQAAGWEARLDAASQAARIAGERLVELRCALDQQVRELAELRAAEARIAAEAARLAGEHEGALREAAQSRARLAKARDEIGQLQARLSVLQERESLLAELESNFEGLETGVKEVLARSRAESPGPFEEVRGLVAEHLQASVELAPLVDAALGEAAQHVVAAGNRLLSHVQSDEFQIEGRVGFVWLEPWRAPAGAAASSGAVLPDSPVNSPCDTAPQNEASVRGDLTCRPGVIGRADRLVDTSPEFAPLVERLLGDTWFVETLADAILLARGAAGESRFVSRNCQVVERDGTLVVGQRRLSEGLVSRRSELRELSRQIALLDQEKAELERQAIACEKEAVRSESRERELGAAHREATTALADGRVAARAAEERHAHTANQRAGVEAESTAAEESRRQCAAELEATRAGLQTAAAELARLEGEMHEVQVRIGQCESARQEHARQAGAARVEAAKSEQRLEALRGRMAQLSEDRQERQRTAQDCRTQAAENLARREQAELEILAATADLAASYLELEALSGDSARQAVQRDLLVAERAALLDEAKSQARAVRKLEEQQHAQELLAGDARHERTTLADRLREDYGIELAAAEHEESPEEEHERQAVEEEIASLRRKINNVGAVNMDALAELEELEARHGALARQFQDLTEAKQALDRIIQKINTDSRRLFTETLEAIRVNFQALYRKAFGGGKADLVLEPGVDILDAGVEIIATPPGKPQFSNSLLSGGEKALTAVALLLAIFQFRPSPFCVLDEVDAPFDEANVGRFIEVLKDFLGWTKFVIVTHSKKTMTAATTLYGVTMQESGVSKRVSVRFDDVSEDGRISREAIEREAAENAA